MERYARQIALSDIGEDGQRQLMSSSALIVGLGGLGCPVGLYLTGAGVGRIGLCDDDVVSLSNLQRQTLYNESEVGMLKVSAAEERLKSLNSEVCFDKWPCRVNEKIIAGYDLVVDCCDNYATRYFIDDVCRRLGKPWVHASIGAFTGVVTVFMPDAGMRYSDLYSDSETLSSEPKASGGVLGTTAGAVGAIAAGEAVKLLAGSDNILRGRMLSLNLQTMQFNVIEL